MLGRKTPLRAFFIFHYPDDLAGNDDDNDRLSHAYLRGIRITSPRINQIESDTSSRISDKIIRG